jgi:hypothetical protein
VILWCPMFLCVKSASSHCCWVWKLLVVHLFCFPLNIFLDMKICPRRAQCHHGHDLLDCILWMAVQCTIVTTVEG